MIEIYLENHFSIGSHRYKAFKIKYTYLKVEIIRIKALYYSNVLNINWRDKLIKIVSLKNIFLIIVIILLIEDLDKLIKINELFIYAKIIIGWNFSTKQK